MSEDDLFEVGLFRVSVEELSEHHCVEKFSEAMLTNRIQKQEKAMHSLAKVATCILPVTRGELGICEA